MPLNESSALNSSQDVIVSGNGSAGTPDVGVITVQGVSGGTALPSSQSGVWNITNISGTVSLPTGAANATNQATEITSLASIQSTSNSTATNTAAIDANQTNGNQRTLVTDLVGNLQPSGDAPVRSIVTRVSDGTSNIGSTAGGLNVTLYKVLTPASPTAATVAATSASALAANSARKGLVMTNTSINTISLNIVGGAAVLNSGITLYPGGVWYMDEFTFTTTAIFAIASAATSNLSIQELS